MNPTPVRQVIFGTGIHAEGTAVYLTVSPHLFKPETTRICR